MRLAIGFLILLIAMLSLPLPVATAQQQEPPPRYFVWLGGGFNGYSEQKGNGTTGFGVRVTDSMYAMSNVIMTSEKATLSESIINYITKQGPVTLASLGELGVTTGNQVTQISFGAGGGVLFDLKTFSKKLENFQVAAFMKIVKPNDAPDPATVLPQFIGGLVYTFR